MLEGETWLEHATKVAHGVEEETERLQRDLRVRTKHKTALERRLEALDAQLSDLRTKSITLHHRLDLLLRERDELLAASRATEERHRGLTAYNATLTDDIAASRVRLRVNLRAAKARS